MGVGGGGGAGVSRAYRRQGAGRGGRWCRGGPTGRSFLSGPGETVQGAAGGAEGHSGPCGVAT